MPSKPLTAAQVQRGEVALDARGRVRTRSRAARKAAAATPAPLAREAGVCVFALRTAGVTCGREPDGTWWVELPLALPSRSNGSHGHHRALSARVRKQRDAVARALAAAKHPKPSPGCGLTVTRVAPGTMDRHDNLPHACKAIVDAFCAWAGFDDGHADFCPAYAQARPTRGGASGVRLAWVERATRCAGCGGKGWVAR
jgi:hypothetical protein